MSETKFLVAVTRHIPEAGLVLLRDRYQLRLSPLDRVLTPVELVRFVKGASAILAELTDKIDKQVLAAAGKQLRVVANYAVGFDNIDLVAARKAKVAVTNTPGVLTEAVAEHTIALMLGVARRLAEADQFVRAGKYKAWAPELMLGPELKGKTLGVLGLGRIGSRVAEIASLGLQMKVIYYDLGKTTREFEQRTGAEAVTIRKLLTFADVLSLHVPFTPKTRHLIGKTELASMKKTAILINTSRGPVVDEEALARALKAGVIWGAGLDVFEFEPKIRPELLKLPNVLLTPHIASASQEARDAMAVLAAKNIIAVLEGRAPLTLVK
jgi:glyoxylate reductase